LSDLAGSFPVGSHRLVGALPSAPPSGGFILPVRRLDKVSASTLGVADGCAPSLVVLSLRKRCRLWSRGRMRSDQRTRGAHPAQDIPGAALRDLGEARFSPESRSLAPAPPPDGGRAADARQRSLLGTRTSAPLASSDPAAAAGRGLRASDSHAEREGWVSDPKRLARHAHVWTGYLCAPAALPEAQMILRRREAPAPAMLFHLRGQGARYRCGFPVPVLLSPWLGM